MDEPQSTRSGPSRTLSSLSLLLGLIAIVAGCAETPTAGPQTSANAATDKTPTSVIITAGQNRFVARGPLTIDSATIADGSAKIFFYLEPGATSDAGCRGVATAEVVVRMKEGMSFEIPRDQGACVISTRNAPTDDTPATVAWRVPVR